MGYMTAHMGFDYEEKPLGRSMTLLSSQPASPVPASFVTSCEEMVFSNTVCSTDAKHSQPQPEVCPCRVTGIKYRPIGNN